MDKKELIERIDELTWCSSEHWMLHHLVIELLDYIGDDDLKKKVMETRINFIQK
jgi:hypothetical protein